MKKFKFPLESVLKVRTLHKRVAERELSVTQARLNHAKKALEENREAYAESFKTLHNHDTNHAFWTDLGLRYQASLQEQQERLKEEKRKLAERLEGEKIALTRKMREEMVISKLKEHQRLEHLQAAEAEVQSEIEEIDLMKRGHKR